MLFEKLARSPQYLAKRLAAERLYKFHLDEGHDVVLPPDELPIEVPQGLMATMAAESNWANEYLTRGFVEEVLKRAKAKVIIGIGDTGAEYISQYLSGAWLPEFATDHTGEGKRDGHGHSHLCAGNIAADHPTMAMGVIRALIKAGYVKIVPKKLLRNAGVGYDGEIDKGLDAFFDMKVPGFDRLIVSCSFGGSTPRSSTQNIIAQGIASGVFVTASAGNNGGTGTANTMGYPARYPKVFGIGALERVGTDSLQIRRAGYSSVGPEMFCTAPGSGILSVTNTPMGVAYWNGTSGSNPHVAAMLACILCMYPEINTYEEAQQFLREFITDITVTPGKAGHDWFFGHGAPILKPYIDQDPVEDPPAPPTEPVRKMREVGTQVSNQTMLWRRQSETAWRKLTVSQLFIKVNSTRPTEPLLDDLSQQVAAYFTNRGIVLTDGMDMQDATWWTAKFLEYVSANEGKPIQVGYIIGKDEKNREVTCSDFTKRIDRIDTSNGTVNAVAEGKGTAICALRIEIA